jgi:homoserine kinase
MSIAIAEAFAPASVANLGVGFDIIGLALKQPGDHVLVERSSESGVKVVTIEGDGGRLPRETSRNTAAVAAQSVLNRLGATDGVRLTIKKHLPLGSGLGSSAASAVAGAVAVNALFGSPLTREELLAPALDGEAVASGYHPDNVGPSLFGGITFFGSSSVESMLRIPVPENLYLALVTPDVVVNTADARLVLPERIELKTMIKQTAGVARLIDALYRSDIHALGKALESDHVIEPARAYLMPFMHTVREAAHRAGAYGLAISGAGPTLVAVCDAMETAKTVAQSMFDTYESKGIRSAIQHTKVGLEGAQVISVA